MSKFEAFTIKYNGRSNVLTTKCHICEGYTPGNGSAAPPLIEFSALWDTGATNTVISKKVVQDLNLKSVGKVPMNHADGQTLVDRYIINIMLPNGVGYRMVSVLCSGLQGTDMLIGMDIIGSGDFSITNVNGKTVFSFRIPSVSEVDYVKEHRAKNAIQSNSISRNALCHCGSGLKYKRCHGK